MFDFTWFEWLIIALGCLSVGVNKTGIPGINAFFVPVLAMILPAKASTGFLLPMLITGDVFAVAYYKRHTQWRYLAKLLPAAVVGVILGYFGLRITSDAQLRPIIGSIVLVMLAFQLWRSTRRPEPPIPQSPWFGVILGLLAGFTTMMANAAGPVMAVYLLSMRLPKEQYVGTGAWFFFIINLIKVPFSASLGLITLESLKINALLIPVIGIGALVGIKVLRVIPQKAFRVVVQIIAAISAVRLMI
jgi:uncharacterized membrane protein YfcA